MSSILLQPEVVEQPPDVSSTLLPARSRWRRPLVAILLLWLMSGVFLVRPDQQAVVTRFGAVISARVYPGIHFAAPWPIDRVYKVKVHQMQRLTVGGDVADGVLGRTEPLKTQFLTGDQNIINMRVAVQYFVALPVGYLFHSTDPEKTVAAAIEAELARRVAHSTVDAVLTIEKIAIQDEVLARAQKLLDAYDTGVKLSTVNIEMVVPPPEAANAFRDVASARADAVRIVDEAQGYANSLLPHARGQAMQLSESAEAYRASKVNNAVGEAERFTAVAAEYAKAPKVTSERLYLETMEQILPKIRKLIVDPNGNLDLSIIRKGEPPPKQ